MGGGDTIATFWSLSGASKNEIINGVQWFQTYLPENTNHIIFNGASVDSIHPITENRTMHTAWIRKNN
jgi:hypothetical protein